jgi:hypothetical protein
MAVYDFESIARFQNREDELAALGTVVSLELV